MTYRIPTGYEPQTIRFEGYGPGDTALVIDAVAGAPVPAATKGAADDLRAAIRAVLQAHDGAMGAAGSVGYLFHRVGRLILPHAGHPASLATLAIESGAEDAIVLPDCIEVLTDPQDLNALRDVFAAAGIEITEATIIERAAMRVPLRQQALHDMQQLLAALRALEGVQAVYSNAEGAT